MVLNQAQVQIDVPIVEGMEELDQIKDSLQFNKLVLSVQEVVKRLPIHVEIVTDKEINKLQKKYLLLFQKESMMELELGLRERVKQGPEVVLAETYTCLLMSNLMNFLKDQM